MATNDIKPKARSIIHEVILNWFSTREKGTVLDAPAGFGHLSMKLNEMNFDVTSGEIEPEIYQVEDVKCIYTDLNGKIDALDNSFDYICCVDGLEHMTDPYNAVAEFSRVLKPGGIGVFSIPNYSNMNKRFRFFIKGYLTKPKHLDQYIENGKNLFNFHNSPLTITLLDVMFSINDLEVEQILRDKIKRKQMLWAPIVYLMKLFAFIASDKKKRKHRPELTLKNEVVLGGNTLIFITRKAK